METSAGVGGYPSRLAEDGEHLRMTTEDHPLNVPLRSLNRSSGCGARTFGVGDDGDATAVSEEPLPHNSCTACETGCARSPAWNNERNIGWPGCCSEAEVIVACDDAAAGVT